MQNQRVLIFVNHQVIKISTVSICLYGIIVSLLDVYNQRITGFNTVKVHKGIGTAVGLAWAWIFVNAGGKAEQTKQ